MWACFKFWPMNNIFRNLQPNENLVMAYLQIYRNYCRLRLSCDFIQTQNRYPIPFDNIRILTWNCVSYQAKNILLTELLENLILAKYFIPVAVTLRCSCVWLSGVTFFLMGNELSFIKMVDVLLLRRIY